MPLYEYRCRSCGEQFEVMQKISDPPLRRCKNCRGRLDKLISRTSFLLKGGGWYAQGYGSSEGGAKSGDSGGESKSESVKEKPAKTDKKKTSSD